MPDYPEIPEADFAKAVQLVDVDGAIYPAAQAVFRALATQPKYAWLLRFYQGSQIFATISEWVYRRVANNRSLISKVI
ncbi:hypothetical protein GCM10007047_07160 [Cerasicoccus arenae]|uniref:DUF393 domain-containing protein n=2 Tax=Cerasicoccus arenae TaxID=424488 RepID=A0A8J3GDT6_9BACT|nr:hypothetical protein GCM10007047_07160 [Cerasicoccus arenae]